MSLRIVTPWRCLWTVLMAIHVASENRWQVLSPTGTAPSRQGGHSAVWRAGTGGMLVFGGWEDLSFSKDKDHNDLHLFLDQEKLWQQLQPTGTPPSPRRFHTAVWCTETGGMLVFGGLAGSDWSLFNDLYLYVNQESRWQLLSPTGSAPTPRRSHSAVWRTGTGGMLVFGGYDSGGAPYLNDLYLYLDQENRWQKLSPSGTAPPSRTYHSAVWRTGTGGMLVFGGYHQDSSDYGKLNDLYLYLDEEDRWQQLSPSGTAPAPRKEHSAVWRTETGGMLVFGGLDKDFGYLNDLYLYLDQENQWQQLSPSGPAPSARHYHTAVWRMETGGMLVYGGKAREDHSSRVYLYMDQAADPSTSRPRTATTSNTATTRTATTSNTATTRTATTSSTATTRTSTTAPTRATNTSHAISFGGVEFEVDPVEQPTSTSSAGVPNPSQKMPWLPQNDHNQEDSPEDASAGLLIAVAMLSVLTCLCTSFGLLCWHRARQPAGNTGREQAEIPNPLAILPIPALIPPAGARPVIFAWNSRMTAEWPRGKVQNVVVEEASFETLGRRFPFQQPEQCRHFAWEDGTIQRVDRIHKNVVSWSTRHQHPAWQRFRWVCTPQCQIEGVLHDMKLVESKCPRCAICSRTAASEKHWYCEQHQVHLCPACAETPPDPPTLGVAASYLVDTFPALARRSTAMDDPNFYDLCPHLAHGPTGLGYTMTCPRDGRPHASMVDALEDRHSGKVSHFVSWCWAYHLEDVVTAVERWLKKSRETPEDVFLWMCFFCNNQYRIKDEGATGSDDLKDIFEGHLVSAGRMLVLLDKITQPTYVTRAWCIFESYVCIAQEIPMTMILPSGAEDFFRETVRSGGIDTLSSAVKDLDVRYARAGSKQDEDLIKRIILTTTGFDAVNDAVRMRLVKELTGWFAELLTS